MLLLFPMICHDVNACSRDTGSKLCAGHKELSDVQAVSQLPELPVSA